jgi:hypothetical protein
MSILLHKHIHIMTISSESHASYYLYMGRTHLVSPPRPSWPHFPDPQTNAFNEEDKVSRKKFWFVSNRETTLLDTDFDSSFLFRLLISNSFSILVCMYLCVAAVSYLEQVLGLQIMFNVLSSI